MPSRPFSLNAYLALARGRGDGRWSPAQKRPDGPILWLHASDPSQLPGLLSLAERALQQRGELDVVLTGAQPDTLPEGVVAERLPEDTLADCEAFLKHWSPALCLWAGNTLRPALVHCASKAGCQMMLVNAEDDIFETPGMRWLPDSAPATLTLFHRVFAANEGAMARVMRLGVARTRVQMLGPLDEAPLPLPCDSTLLDTYSEALAARPVWFASFVTADELNSVLLAHRRALRASHRLLLILATVPDLAASDKARALTYLNLRAADADPEAARGDSNQVMISQRCSDAGLWYRLAPVSFIGGSLTDGVGGHSPYHAATLGSCIFHGPNVSNHSRAYARLGEAGAARVVRDTEALASEVTRAIMPDRSAAMAHAGWDVITGGAQLTDTLVELILETLDRAEVA